jgi:hypothetical protein
MFPRSLLSAAVGLGCSSACGQVFTAPPSVVSVPVAGGTYALGGYWGYGLPVVPHVRYPSYDQGYFDAGIGATPVPLGNIVTIGGILYLQNADGTLTLFR